MAIFLLMSAHQVLIQCRAGRVEQLPLGSTACTDQPPYVSPHSSSPSVNSDWSSSLVVMEVRRLDMTL
jgi:hypothetical protein